MIRYIKALFGVYDHYWTEFESDLSSLPFSYYKDKTQFLIGNDWHYGSKYQDNPRVKGWIDAILDGYYDSGNLILNGDIIDRSCCPKDRVVELTDLIFKLKNKMLHDYELGNHERFGLGNRMLIKTTKSGKRVWFDHSDLIGNYAKWSKYRLNETLGATKLELIKVDLLDDMDWLKGKRPLPKNAIENADKEMQVRGCDIGVFAHYHFQKARRYEYNGRVQIYLPAHQLSELWL